MHLLHMVVLYIALYHWDVKAGPFHAFSMPTLLSLSVSLSLSLCLTLSFYLTRSFTGRLLLLVFAKYFGQAKKRGEQLFINGLSINCCRVPCASKQAKTGC